jgi:hypothetical protein
VKLRDYQKIWQRIEAKEWRQKEYLSKHWNANRRDKEVLNTPRIRRPTASRGQLSLIFSVT